MRQDASQRSALPPPRGPAAPAPPWSGLLPAREVLSNGVTVIVKESPTTPAVTLHLCLNAGTICDPVGLDGLAHFLSKTIDQGTRLRTADEIAEAFDACGATLGISVNRHSLSIVCTCLAEDVGDVLALLADMIREPVFPAAEVETRRGEIVTLIRQDADSPATVAMEILLAALYSDGHPYGRPARGTLDTVATIDCDALRRFHADWVVPTSLTIAVVGDIAATAAVDAARVAFGNWSAQGRPMPTLPTIAAAACRRVRVVPMMNKAQADLAYGFITVARNDPRYAAYALMNNILAQYSIGGRLGERIRERQGMAYYVFSAFEPTVIPGPLVLRAGVSAANVERALASIDAELRLFIDEGPTERELAESRQYLVGSLPRQLETNAAIAKFLVVAECFGLGLNYELRIPALLGAVTRAEVQAAARDSLDPSRGTVVVAGPYDGSPA
jgi:zinc protease